MMNERRSFKFKKTFRGTTHQGITLHWLRCTYGQGFENAISNAVKTIYAPSALVSSAESWEKVVPTVNRSRAMFRESMALSHNVPPPPKPIAERVKVTFSKTFEVASEEGQVFEWLFQSDGENAGNSIIHAVCLVYSPAALASSPDTKAEALLQVERSRLVFEDMMTQAIAQASVDEKALIANRLNKTFIESEIQEEAQLNLPVLPNRIQEEDSLQANGQIQAHTSNDDFDDDFVPVDFDLDFDK